MNEMATYGPIGGPPIKFRSENTTPSRKRLGQQLQRVIQRFIAEHELKREDLGEIEKGITFDSATFLLLADRYETAGNYRGANTWRQRATRIAAWEKCYAELERLWSQAGNLSTREESDGELAREVQAALADIAKRHRLENGASEVLRRLTAEE